MRGHAGKLTNDYAEIVSEMRGSKAVWMAVAVSLAIREIGARSGTPTSAEITEYLWAEWDTLHANGIIPQQPRRNGRPKPAKNGPTSPYLPRCQRFARII